MIMPNAKQKPGVIMAMEEAPEASEMPEENPGYDVAAQELMAAIDAKDVAGVKEALKSFMSMCMDESAE